MKKSLLSFSILLISFNLHLGQQNETEKDSTEQAAIKVAQSWLVLVDNGSYGESWEQAATLFKNVIPKEKCEEALTNLLPPFGELISREIISSKYETSLPGAPDGKYVVITYKSKFSKKATSIETITPMKDKDGVWRISGYFIN
jgi:Protein of unknown function (DUF4019)